jgi:hypothetical protein
MIKILGIFLASKFNMMGFVTNAALSAEKHN